MEAFGRWLACADREGVFCVGGGRRLARRVPNEFGLWRPSAGGRPAPTEGMVFASAEADAWRGAPQKADFNRRGGLRPCVPNEFGLWRPSAGGRPAPTEGIAFASAEADAWRASALEGRFQSAGGPSADGRPAPTGRVSFALAEADAWRAAPLKADFNRRGGLRQTIGLCRPGGVFCVGGGRRLARRVPNEFGLWRPSADGRPAPTGRCLLRWRRPTLGAQRL